MSDRKQNQKKIPGPNDPTQASRDKQQEELARKLPDDPAPAEERGERLATGKQIATGGKMDRHGSQ